MSYSAPPPPPNGPGDPYGAQQGYGAYGQPQTSKKAIWSLVTGILGFCCGPSAIVAIVLAVTGKKDIAASNGSLKGGGMAQAGLILGIIALVLGVIYYILLFTGNASFNFNTSP